MNNNNRQNPHKMVVIEGNIGSGKSTLLKLVNERLQQVQTVKEPVNEWQAINGNPELNLLDAFYKDPKRWAYTFQTFAYFSRLQQWSEIEIKSDVAVAERSVLSDKHIFAINGHKQGLFNELEWALYEQYFDFLIQKFDGDKINGIIYVDTEPEVCQKRIGKRGREEEKDSIPLEYLKSLHDRHQEWLIQDKENKYPILRIDGSQDYSSDPAKQQEVIQQIQDFIDRI